MAHRHDAVPTLNKLRLPLALTRLGLLAEQVLRCFWPLMSIVMLVLAALMLGLYRLFTDILPWQGLLDRFLPRMARS